MPHSLLRMVCLGACLCVLGCAERDERVIRFGLATPPVTLDPRFATDATSYRLSRLLFESLVDFNDAFEAVPALATWRQLSPTRYQFELNTTRSFHDGSALLAGDVVATYRSVLNPNTVSPHRGSLDNISSVKAVSPTTVEFVLDEPDPLFPGLLVIGIMSATQIDGHHDRIDKPIGSGPFALDARGAAERLSLRRIDDQQVVEFVTIRDATVRALKLLHGEIDLIQGSMTPELVDWLSRREHIRAVQRPGTTFTYLGFNLEDPDLDDVRVRRAIAHAIDREELVKYLFGGRARLAQALFGREHWAGAASLEAIPYDPDTARHLLSAAGYGPDNPLVLSYKTSSDYFRLRVATTIQQQLAVIGVRVEIQSYDWGTFYGDVKAGRFQMYSLSWVGLKQPDIFRYAFHSESIPPTGANRGRYRATEIDRLIELAETSSNTSARAQHYAAIQEQLLNDLPYVPLWYEDNTLIHRDTIKHYDTNRDGDFDQLVHIEKLAARD